ncbi:MAG TPA: 3-keto-5-aminohexanoate cleavage protein [Ktedonobacteraceae bacterium]|jgi:3-keto-5-aminohexanoate cleavage enzyme|nr:3-keto-5-aminohexanoate cleavage protein [Ktedonobacteraceae bacterium]
MQPVIITAALVGAEVTREQQPHLPITPQEIISAAVECYEAGASIIHIHVRDAQGNATQDGALFSEVVEGIRARCDVITQVSTGGAVWMSAEERLQSIECRPDMATLTTGTVNFGDGVFMNNRGLVESFARRLREYGIVPEIEVFDVGMIDEALRLHSMGLISDPIHFDFVMGVPGALVADPVHLVHMVRCLPPDSTWSVAGIGRHQLTLGTIALAMGGNVRVGFEDNIYYRKGQLAKSNAELVARIARIAGELDRPVATPAQAREILQLERYRKQDDKLL